MRVGIIDLGTNSVRFDVHEFIQDAQGGLEHRRLYREKAMVRLGESVFETGHLNSIAKKRTLDALKLFVKVTGHLKVHRMIALGTSALRDAEDGRDFIKEVKEKTGISIKLISGHEEAVLIAKGVLSGLTEAPKGNWGIVDIGGGSTEVSTFKKKSRLVSFSFNLGVARLEQVFPKSSLSRATEKALRKHIRETLKSHPIFGNPVKQNLLIGSSGTIVALARVLDPKTGSRFTAKSLKKWVKRIQNKTPGDLLSIKGVEPKRADLLFVGSVLMDEIVQHFKATQVQTTERTLRDGVVDQIKEQVLSSTSAQPRIPFKEIREKLIEWRTDLKHADKVREHACFIFDHTQSLHGLTPEDRELLEAAALLHDVGEIVSHSKHAEHSAYLVKNARFPFLGSGHTHLVSQLVRYHKDEDYPNAEFSPKHPEFLKFTKILALLKLADALDRSHRAPMTLVKLQRSKKKLKLYYKSKSGCELEHIRFNQRKKLFETLFKTEIVLLSLPAAHFFKSNPHKT